MVSRDGYKLTELRKTAMALCLCDKRFYVIFRFFEVGVKSLICFANKSKKFPLSLKEV